MVAAKTDSNGRRGWQITAIAALITIFIQISGWVWWFGGWKSTTDLRIKSLEDTFETLPETVNRIDVNQRIMTNKLDSYLRNQDRDD